MSRLTALCLMAVLLAGCAAQTGRLPGSPGWEEHSARLREFNHWQAEGKLALRSSRQSESASLVWVQQRQQTDLRLSGPMGLNATTIRSDGRRLEVLRGDDSRSWDVADGEQIRESTGWDLPPLPALQFWIRGLPAPEGRLEDLQLEQDLLQQFTQDGWQITYEAYQQFEQLTLPTRLRIQRGDTSARVIIRNWITLPV